MLLFLRQNIDTFGINTIFMLGHKDKKVKKMELEKKVNKQPIPLKQIF